uniref:hypothetical protein n=1 Tax=Streptomyces sp. NBC_00998 TaxID=2903712 RepID=UPI002F91491E|nr:hypothetical protein OG513_38910 [Streptomyces sp. NBC_00998]
MSNTPQHDSDHTLAYPEPPAHPMWHRLGPKPQPLTPDQQQRNTERLLRALRAPAPAPLVPPRPCTAAPDPMPCRGSGEWPCPRRSD